MERGRLVGARRRPRGSPAPAAALLPGVADRRPRRARRRLVRARRRRRPLDAPALRRGRRRRAAPREPAVRRAERGRRRSRGAALQRPHAHRRRRLPAARPGGALGGDGGRAHLHLPSCGPGSSGTTASGWTRTTWPSRSPRCRRPGFQCPSALAAQWNGVVATAVDAQHAGRPPAGAVGLVPHARGAGRVAGAPAHGAGPGRAAVGAVQPRAGGHGAVPARQHGRAGRRCWSATPATGPACRRCASSSCASSATALPCSPPCATGEVDAALLGETPTDGRARAAGRAARPRRHGSLPRGGYTVLYLNNQRRPLDDPLLRRALAASIDAAALVDAVAGGRGLPGDGPIVPTSWAFVAGDWPPPGEADALFDAAGWPRAGGRRPRTRRPAAGAGARHERRPGARGAGRRRWPHSFALAASP